MTDSVPPPFQLPQPPAEDVFAATEEVRAADFPEVPAELLAAVLAAEQNNPDNRISAARAVAHAVEAWLVEHPDEPAVTPTTSGLSGGTGS